MSTSIFPTGILPYPTTPVVDGQTIYSQHVWTLYDELSGVEANLGLNIKGAYASANSRFNALESGVPWTGGTITITIVPTNSGTLSIGTTAKPFGGIYANQYATTLYTTVVSGTGISSTVTVNWNNGSSQIIDYTYANSGVSNLVFTSGIAGSFYVLNTIQNVSGTDQINWSGGSWLWRGATSGTMTTTSGAQDIFSFFYNGTKYLGNAGKGYL